MSDSSVRCGAVGGVQRSLSTYVPAVTHFDQEASCADLQRVDDQRVDDQHVDDQHNEFVHLLPELTNLHQQRDDNLENGIAGEVFAAPHSSVVRGLLVLPLSLTPATIYVCTLLY